VRRLVKPSTRRSIAIRRSRAGRQHQDICELLENIVDLGDSVADTLGFGMRAIVRVAIRKDTLTT
jgi:hypothetical protein